MVPFANIIEDILLAVRRTKNSMYRKYAKRWANEKYFEICRTHSWAALRRKVEVDMESTSYSDGMYLPANLFGVDRIRDTTNDFEFVHRDRHDIEPDEYGYRYYTYCPEDTALYTHEDGYVAHGATTFTSADLGSEDGTGEYIQFGSEPGFYLLSAATTFAPTYYGPQLEKVWYVIRPKTTQKLVITDHNENELEDRTVDVYYWKAPDPLYRDHDLMVLPIARPLVLAVIIKFMGLIGKREIATDRYRKEYNEALGEALELNPDAPRPNDPRDKHNELFSMQETFFGKRHNDTYSNDREASLRDLIRR